MNEFIGKIGCTITVFLTLIVAMLNVLIGHNSYHLLEGFFPAVLATMNIVMLIIINYAVYLFYDKKQIIARRKICIVVAGSMLTSFLVHNVMAQFVICLIFPILVDVVYYMLVKEKNLIMKDVLKNLMFCSFGENAVFFEVKEGMDYIDGCEEYKRLAKAISLQEKKEMDSLDFYIDRFKKNQTDDSIRRFVHITGNGMDVNVIFTDIIKEDLREKCDNFVMANAARFCDDIASVKKLIKWNN